ncbi:MAG: GFA family protein [Gammaproteobacteria bacterium]|nr:GFA family protein [Gammaproteobacteria bacterium]
MNDGPARWHRGGCHCGDVKFEVRAPAVLDLLECNCSMCTRSAYLHLIVPAGDFRLLTGAEALTEYRFGTGTARHLFCRRCGVKSFYVPRSHPDGYSVNARCLEPSSIASMRVKQFDGRHWEASRAGLAREGLVETRGG